MPPAAAGKPSSHRGDKVIHDLEPDHNNPSTVGTGEYADDMIEQLGAWRQ